MREDVKKIYRAIDEFDRHPSQESWCDEEITAIHSLDEKLPAPVRGIGYLLRMLPPSTRWVGVVAVTIVIVVAVLRGVSLS